MSLTSCNYDYAYFICERRSFRSLYAHDIDARQTDTRQDRFNSMWMNAIDMEIYSIDRCTKTGRLTGLAT